MEVTEKFHSLSKLNTVLLNTFEMNTPLWRVFFMWTKKLKLSCQA